MPGDEDLTNILCTMQPTLQPETFVFVSVSKENAEAFSLTKLIVALEPKSTVWEHEGLSLIVEESKAAEFQKTCKCEYNEEDAMRMISLTVHSALTMCGLTAAISRAMSDEKISCNVVAGFYHDHLFVEAARADDAMTVLKRMSEAASTSQ